MAKYEVTYSCGHTGRVDLVGKGDYREWKLKSLASDLCPECYKIQADKIRAENSAKAEKSAKEMELPDLIGTEKQIAWALTLRQNLIDCINTHAEDKKEALDVLNYILFTHTDSKYWIDRRVALNTFNAEMRNLVCVEQEEMHDVPTKAIEKEIEKELIVTPENSTGKATVTIVDKDGTIITKSEKDATVIDILKKYYFRWDGAWTRESDITTGSAADRIAELGNVLLAAGYPVLFESEEIKQKAIAGLYEPEHTRWILKNAKDPETLMLWWRGRDEKAYSLARKVKGSKYVDGAVIAGIAHMDAITNLIKFEGFVMSDAAKEAVKAYDRLHEAKIVVALADNRNSVSGGM